MNEPKDLESAISYFSVFGGFDKQIDMSKPLEELIEKHILNEYRFLRNEVGTLSTGDNLFHSILTGIALGDRRTNSSFKRAKVSFNEGIKCVDELCDLGVLKLEKSFLKNEASEKLLFATPFLRFWFALVSPLYQGIKQGDYKEFFENFANRKIELEALVFEQLSHEFVKKIFVEDKVYDIGRYWDESDEIDLIAKTKSGKIILGSSKYTNSKVKKSELNRLTELGIKLGLHVDCFILFSKSGFSSELKALKNQNLQLYTPRNFKILI